jgi:hypothetical protein
MARWMGLEAFHAGALVGADGAWALAGGNEAGKSTLLAALAVRGEPVLTDDLLVVDRAGTAYAGPRCIDLRELRIVGDGVGQHVRLVRGATRHRLDLPPVSAAVALRGWLFLEWGSRVQAERCAAGARIARLMAQRRWATGAIDELALLELAALPAWTVRRPRGERHTGAVLALLEQITGRARAAGGDAADPAGAPGQAAIAPRACA